MLEQGVLETTGDQISTGGRRAGTLRLARGLGVLLAVALGAPASRSACWRRT
jgi:hypothetical protein